MAAAALRFVGLSHHLIHGGQSYDESNNFVEPVLRMWNRGTWNPGPYPGYPGFFNHLIAVPVLLGLRWGGEVGAYVGARGVVACFSLLNVLLMYVLGRRLYGGAAGLLGAALMAVSRGEIREAHSISPDVLVVWALLTVLLLTLGAPATRRRDLAAAALVGLATAVKYTGLLLSVTLAVALAAGHRLRSRWLASFALAAAVFLSAAPFALIDRGDQGFAIGDALQSYFGRDLNANATLAEGDVDSLRSAASLLVLNLGVPGLLLLAVASPLVEKRIVLPVAATLLAALAALALANLVYTRHVLLPSAAATVLVMGAFDRLLRLAGRRWRYAVGVSLSAVVLFAPTEAGLALAGRYRQTPTADQAARWLSVRQGLVASELQPFSLPSQLEVRSFDALRSVAPQVLAQYDYLVAPTEASLPPAGFEVLARFRSRDPRERAIDVLRLRAPPLEPAPAPSAIDASADVEGAGACCDGSAETAIRFAAGRGWLRVGWEAPVVVARVDLEVADARFPQAYDLEGLAPDGEWTPLEAVNLRPTLLKRQRAGAPPGQAFVLTPARRLTGLRVERGWGPAWQLSELRVYRESE